MAFEILLNNPMTEPKLLELLTAEVQKNYKQHQNMYYFFKLSYTGERNSKIIWKKTFNNNHDFVEFNYDTKFMRAAIMLKFRNGHYEVLCIGFCYTERFEIWPYKTLNHRFTEHTYSDTDKTPMPPRELIERGFGEITQELAKSKSNIPV